MDKNHPILGFFHGWVLEFAKHFGEVHVICLQKGECALPPNVYVYSLGKEDGESKAKYVYRFYRYFTYVFFDVRVEYVFFHMGSVYNLLSSPFFFLRKLYGTKFYWWKTHGTLSPMSRAGLHFVDRVYTAASVSFPKETRKKYVVGHAIDFSDSITAPRPQTPPVVLFVGRVTPRKRLDVLIDTSAVLRKRGVPHVVRIVGDTPDADYLQKIRALITKHHLDSTTEIVGPKIHSELGSEYATASVLVNPSETGGIDKVVLEALGHGLPAIALESTYTECVSDTSLLVKSQSPEAYADAVETALRAMSQNPNAYASLKAEVTKRHSLETLSQRIFSI